MYLLKACVYLSRCVLTISGTKMNFKDHDLQLIPNQIDSYLKNQYTYSYNFL